MWGQLQLWLLKAALPVFEDLFTVCFCQVWMSYAAFEATPQALLGQRQEEEEEQPQVNDNTADARRAAALQAEDPMAAAAREEQARRLAPSLQSAGLDPLGCGSGCCACNSAASSSPEDTPAAIVMHRLALCHFQGQSGWLAHLLLQLSSWFGGADSCYNAPGPAGTLVLDIMALLLQLAQNKLCSTVLLCCSVYSRAFSSLRESQPDAKEEAVMLLEAWRAFEAESNTSSPAQQQVGSPVAASHCAP